MRPETEKLAAVLLSGGTDRTRLLKNAPMREYTSFRIGGPADLLLRTADEGEVKRALSAAKECSVPVTVIGNGSNLLVRDGGIRGLVLRLSGECAGIRVITEEPEAVCLSVPAGCSLSALAQETCRRGLAGLAPLSGIPGTLGGGAVMNAGAYGGELSQVVTAVRCIRPEDGTPVLYEKDALGFGYRRSAMAKDGVLVTRVSMRLPRGNPEDIRREMADLALRRREKQPLEFPSAGSAFKRPPGQFAAKLIDEAGLRGFSIGGAAVSEKHAGFIINRGGAIAADVLSLMEEVRRRVFDRTGIFLEPEIRILGEDSIA